MAANIIIPINDSSPAQCYAEFQIRYMLSSGGNWTNLPVQYGTPYGSPLVDSLIISNLLENTSYDVEVTARCCDGSYNTPYLISILTAS